MAPKKTKSTTPTVTATPAKEVAKPSSSKRSSSSPTPLLVSVFVAVVAFLGGVLTPPALHVLRQPAMDAIPPAPQTVESLSTNNLPRHTPCNPSNLANYLHNSPVAGLHVVCIDPIHVDANGKEKPHAQTDVDRQHRIEQSNSLRLTLYKGSHSTKIRRRVTMSGDKGVESISWNEMKMQLSLELGLIPPGRKQQPWAIFTPLGERIVGTDEMVADDNLMTKLASSEMLVITNGGVWIWPGVREGFERTIELPPTKYDKNSREVTIETLSLQPLVLSVEGFLTDEECKYIPEVAGPSMEYSEVSLKDADKGKSASEWRTSQSTFLPANDDSILKAIDERTAKLVRIPRTHQEYAQVLRYGPTEKYDAHHDYFDPAAYQSDEGTLALIEHGKRNRFATVFWYLSDVAEGGETIFPRYGGAAIPRNYADCSVGLKVKPQRGKVIIFYSLTAMGNMDPLSLHGACPVGGDGVKWAANKWVWNAPMYYIKDD